MIAANQPTAFPVGDGGRSDNAARPPWSDRHYLYPHAWQPAGQHPASSPWPHAGARPAAELLDPGAPANHDHASAHAVIGNRLRMPSAWCEYGSCISRFADPAALGESDIRSRALTAGWRQDALGRLVCPTCLQRDPTFQTSFPIVPRHTWPAPSDPPSHAEPLRAEPLRAEPLRAEPLPEPGQASWTGGQPRLQLAMTETDKPGLVGFRRREAGRHRLKF